MDSDISVASLRAKVDDWHTLKKSIKTIEMEAEEKTEPLRKSLSTLEGELFQIMEAMEIKKFDGAIGKITVMEIDYVSNPATEEAKKQFFDYLKSEGIFDEMVSVHYQKLNSFFKTKLEEAIEKQEVLNIPGLELKTRKEIRGYKL